MVSISMMTYDDHDSAGGYEGDSNPAHDGSDVTQGRPVETKLPDASRFWPQANAQVGCFGGG